jgi:hypothetical protein
MHNVPKDRNSHHCYETSNLKVKVGCQPAVSAYIMYLPFVNTNKTKNAKTACRHTKYQFVGVREDTHSRVRCSTNGGENLYHSLTRSDYEFLKYSYFGF